jgi:diketogulonate reductase-like aldo/keto reductase
MTGSALFNQNAKAQVTQALKEGFTHIDTAQGFSISVTNFSLS